MTAARRPSQAGSIGVAARRARRGLWRHRHQPALRLQGQHAAFRRRADRDQPRCMGILSLIFWSLVLIVTVKYVMLIMRADNRGEGGILALMALAQRVSVGTRIRNALTLVGIAGACLFFGDGVITPAISVLSAVEGLEVSDPRTAAIRPADQRGGHRRAVRRAVARHRQRRPHVRAGHGAVVPGHRRARHCGDRAAPVRAAGAVAELRGRTVRRSTRVWPSSCSARSCCA